MFGVNAVAAISRCCHVCLQAEEGPAESSASDQSTWKDDNEGFRDTAKGPRRSRNLKQRPQPDMATERPANGYSKANGRIEDGRYPRCNAVTPHERGQMSMEISVCPQYGPLCTKSAPGSWLLT